MPLELRPLQIKTIEAAREAFRQGHKRLMIYGPTGFGKTECAIALMNATKQNGNKSAMVLDRIVLCDQTSKRLDKYDINHGVLQSGNPRYRPYEDIQICSAQTLEARGSLPGMKLMIVDEAHCQRKMVIEFIHNSDIYVIGLSASPFTKGLANTYEHVISCTTTKELVEQGWLVPLKVYIAKEIDMNGANKVAGEWSVKEVTTRGRKIVGDVVAEWEKMTMLHFGKPEKTIVFSAGVDHGDELENQFKAAGYNFLNISYRDNNDYKKAVLEAFSEPDTDIVGVIATDILTKGFDCADVKIGVSTRPFSKSFSSHVQQLGRVMRPFEGKTFALWLDHSGNYLRFWQDWEDLYNYGVDKLSVACEKTKKEPTEKQKEAAKCPVCGALWEGGDTCKSCGHTIPKNTKMVTTPGELVALEEKHREEDERHNKQLWYCQLLGYVTENNERHKEKIEAGKKKPISYGWAAHKFKEKFGEFPNGLEKKQLPCGKEVSGWIKHTFIRRKHARR